MEGGEKRERWEDVPHAFDLGEFPPAPHDVLLVAREEEAVHRQAGLRGEDRSGGTAAPVFDGLEQSALLECQSIEVRRGWLLQDRGRLIPVHGLDGVPVDLDVVDREERAVEQKARDVGVDDVVRISFRDVVEGPDAVFVLGEHGGQLLLQVADAPRYQIVLHMEVGHGNIAARQSGEEEGHVDCNQSMNRNVALDLIVQVAWLLVCQGRVEHFRCSNPFSAENSLISGHESREYIESRVPAKDLAARLCLHDRVRRIYFQQHFVGGLLMAEQINPVSEVFLVPSHQHALHTTRND